MQSILDLQPNIGAKMLSGDFSWISEKAKAISNDLERLNDYLIRESGRAGVALATLEQLLDELSDQNA